MSTLRGLDDGGILLKDANTMVHHDSWLVGCVERPQNVQHQPRQYSEARTNNKSRKIEFLKKDEMRLRLPMIFELLPRLTQWITLK